MTNFVLVQCLRLEPSISKSSRSLHRKFHSPEKLWIPQCKPQVRDSVSNIHPTPIFSLHSVFPTAVPKDTINHLPPRPKQKNYFPDTSFVTAVTKQTLLHFPSSYFQTTILNNPQHYDTT